MSKLTLNDLTSLGNETSALAGMASNNAAIVAAMDNTLSLDGTTPNSMGANLDMNSNDIINVGSLFLTGLPTSDPAVSGQVWNDGGTLKVSAG